MSDIFLSYASEDVAQAGELAHALMRCGWSVWWDRSILPGKVFDTVIEAELSAAKCVIVLWSQRSVASRWVRAEAGEALDKGRLIPALIDDAVIPLVFRQVQAASLSGWGGDTAHPGFQQLVKAISAVAPPQTMATATVGDAKPPVDTQAPDEGTKPDHRTGWWAFSALAVLVLAVGAFNFFRDNSSTALSRVADEQRPEFPQDKIAAPSVPQTPVQKDSDRSGEADAQAKPEQPAPGQMTAAAEAAKPAAPAPIPDPPKPAGPVVEKPMPVAVKPAIDKPAPTPPETVAMTETAPAPAAPLTVLAVTWAMPNDNGTASAANVKKYSTSLSKMMTSVVKDTLQRQLAFDYYYPSQQEYYRLLKEAKDYGLSKKLCGVHKADLVISAFVKGAEFVSASFGYALTRNPVFSVYDCKANKKITQTYQIAEHVDDNFPFEKSTTTAFRKFVTQDAALAKH